MLDNYAGGACQGFDYARFWSHSLLMAVVMQELGARTRDGAPDDLFACGLLARIGCLGLATAYPDEYAEPPGTAGASICLLGWERQRLGTDHNELTAALLHDWGIPPALVDMVFHHESPETSGFTPGSRPDLLTELLHPAGKVSDRGLAPESGREEPDAEILLFGSVLGLDADAFNALEVMPQVVVTDWLMPGMDGPEFCRTLRGTEWGQTPYVLILTDVVTVSQLNKAFDAGVDDYLLKPVIGRDPHLRLRAARRQAKLQEDWSRDRMQRRRSAADPAISNRKPEHAALTDPLTDLPNRRAAMTLLEQAWRFSRGYSRHPSGWVFRVP